MSTHTAGAERAYDELLTALEDYSVGEAFLADSWRARADAAQLTSAEVSAAHRRAKREGYLVAFVVRLPGGRKTSTSVPSETPSRKSGNVSLYTRTSKALPHRAAPAEHGRERVECAGQTDLLEAISS
jgi:hypothetical protein